MIAVMTALVVWPIASLALLLGCRAILILRLAHSGVHVRFVWTGVPGYLERTYLEAPENVRLRLAKLQRWNRLFLVNLVVSLILCFFVAVPVLLSHR